MIVITAYGEVPIALRALRAGAVEFIEKPFPASVLIDAILPALQSRGDALPADAGKDHVRARLQLLTISERQVMEALTERKANAEISEILGISQSTVDVHRVKIMEKMNARSLSALVRMAVAAGFKV